MTLSPQVSMLKVAIPLAVAALAVAGPAFAASQSGTAPSATAATPAPAAPARLAPVAGVAPRTAAQATTASATCARYATRAGWPDNGYFGGDLVTATAICVAESTGDPRLYVCDENGIAVGHGDFVQGQPIVCPSGTTSYDRGLWQLNSKAASSVSDTCAFNPVCNAGQAYLHSGRGTDFAPWSSYDQDVYPKFIDPAQTVISSLGTGTVTSALLGECLAEARPVAGARVVIANCGSGAASQQWSIAGGKLRSGSLCAVINSPTASTPGVVLQACGSAKTQDWAAYGRNQLRNAADGKCLTDPASSLAAGTQVVAAACAGAKSQTWWLP